MAVADLYIGIMSGTSLDGIDVVLCRFDEPRIELLAHRTFDWPTTLHRKLRELVSAEYYSIDELATLHVELSRAYADGVNQLLASNGISSTDVRAIGLHGQTIRHLPHLGATWQLGSGAALAAFTQIDVVHDFRSADVALGGQGAPLVPMFDLVFLSSSDRNRLVTNIGGIANVTYIPRSGIREDVTAFDTGPGNMIVDTLTQEFLGRAYDENGVVASSGTIDQALLSNLLSHRFFRQPPPKSTGRELMQHDFIPQFTDRVRSHALTIEDALATAVELTAITLVAAANNGDTKKGPNSDFDLILSGGGAKNGFLVSRIASHLPSGASIILSSDLGIDPQAKESIAFAYFAKAFIERIHIHLPHTTGASRMTVLGSLSPGR